MGTPFLDETMQAIAAANEFVREKEERAIAAGRSVYFMDDEGRYYERNREGVFEIVPSGDQWVRTRELARRLDARELEPERALER